MPLSDDFDNALAASNYTLTQTPGLAVDAATSGDPENAGMALSHASQVQAAQAAAAKDDAKTSSGGGFWHTIIHGAEQGVNDALDQMGGPGLGIKSALGAVGVSFATAGEALNVPLAQNQANYRYVHEVYARQGVVPGFLATLGIAGVAAAGTAVGGGRAGGVIGAFAAGEAERGAASAGFFGDGFKQDAQIADDPNTKVSPGRDFSNALSHLPGLAALANTDKGWGKVVSGAGDATFDINMDPAMRGLAVYKDLKYGLDSQVAREAPIRNFLSAPGLKANSPEQVDKLLHSPFWGKGYRTAASEIAGMSEGDIAARYPQLAGAAADMKLPDGSVVQGLGSAKTLDEVHDVFKRVAFNQELADRMFSGTLPSKALMRKAGGNVAEWMRNQAPEGAVSEQKGLFLPTKTSPGASGFTAPAAISAPLKAIKGDVAGAGQDISGAIARKVRTFTGYLPFAMDKNTLKLSTQTFDPMDPGSLQGVYRSFRYSMGEQTAREWTSKFAQADSLADKKRIWAEGNMEMLKAAGLPDDPDLLKYVTGQSRQMTMGPAGSEMYGVGLQQGADVSKVALGNGSLDDMALWTDQRGNFSFPDFQKVKQAMREQAGYASGQYGKFDEFTAKHYTNTIFKPLALVNAGFGLRVALSEGIPAALKYGAINQLTAGVAASAAKVNYKLDPDRLTGQADSLMARSQAASDAGNSAAAAAYERQAGDLYDKASTRVEHYHVLSAMQKALGGFEKMLGATDEERDLAARIVMSNEGHFVKGVADTGHGNSSFYLPEDPNLRGDAVVHYGKQWLGKRTGLKPTGDYAPFGADSADFNNQWRQELQRRSQNNESSAIAGDLQHAYTQGMSHEDAAAYAQRIEATRIKAGQPVGGQLLDQNGLPVAPVGNVQAYSKATLGRHKLQTPEAFAADRVDAMQGLLVGRDGKFHSDLADMVANRIKPTESDIAAIGEESRPKQVMGEIYEPWTGGGSLQSLVSMGFQKLVDPVINKLSREPTYFNAVKNEWDQLKYLRENGLDENDALRIAQYRGSQAMLPQIHNTELRTQFHALTRNYLPFSFAQQQAVQRSAIALAQNPNAIRGYQLAHQGLNDPGFVQTDGNGSRYLMLPVVGQLGAGFQSAADAMGLPIQGGLPMTVSGSMQSLNTVLPEMQLPGVSPLVSIPLNALSSLSDEVHAPWANSFAGITKGIVGDRGYGAAVFDSAMPNAFIRNTIMAASPDEQSRSYSNAVVSALASAYYHGKAPDPGASPMEKQEFMDRIKNNARSLFAIKALVGLVSPLSPQVAQEDQGFRDEFYKMVKSKDYSAAIQQFMNEHGSKAISYTVAGTEAAIPGASMPYTQQAIDWIQQHDGLVNGKLATGAAFLIPQDPSGGDAQKVSQQLLQMHLRSRRTPDEFLKAVYVSAGNSAISADKKVYDTALEKVSGDKTATANLKQAWSDHVSSMALWNPLWYDDYASPLRKNLAAQAYNQLQTIFQADVAPAGTQSDKVSGLMDSYEKYKLQMAALANSRTDSANTSRQGLRDSWQKYLDEKITSDPASAPVIRSVFARLPDA